MEGICLPRFRNFK